MATRFEKITYLGRNDPTISMEEHVSQMRETNEVPSELKNKWYGLGIARGVELPTYIDSYYQGTDYWKSPISNDELLSQITIGGGHSRLLKIAGRRIAELLDEIAELKKPGRP